VAATTPESAPPMAVTGTLYLLDTHGLLFQMFHGIPNGMSAPDGRPTNAVFGVTRALMSLEDQGADYLIATFDSAEPTFRHTLCPEYKSHRPPPPDDLLVQEPMIHQILEAMRIPILKTPGYEADDIMATLAVAGAARGLKVFLCTSDKDCRQLLSDQIHILNLRKGQILDVTGLQAEWGITPEQVVDFQALVGDSVDNIRGVPGCGPKTAAKWLQEYGNLEGIIAHVDDLGGAKLRQALKQAIADGSLEQSRQLVRLNTHVPLEFDWDGWKRRDWDYPRLLALFQEFDFRSFANKVRSTLTASGRQTNTANLALAGIPAAIPTDSRVAKRMQPATTAGGDLFHSLEIKEHHADEPDRGRQRESPFGANRSAEPSGLPKQEAWSADYRLINTSEAFASFLQELQRQPRFCFDLETTSLDPLRGSIVGYAFCWQPGRAYYLPVRGPAGSQVLDPAATLEQLRPLLENPAIGKVNQNIKFDQLVLRTAGVSLAGVVSDPMIADYLLHAGERSHGLDELSRRYLGHENIPISDLIGKGTKQISMDQVPPDKVKEYAAEDADTAWRLAELLEAELAPAGLRTLYDDLEIPLIAVLADLEFTGIRLDLPRLAQLSAEMQQQLTHLEIAAHALAGKPFNLGSPKQLREILFTELKLPIQKRTSTTGEPSTDQESLERLAALGHELPRVILEHRQIAKLKGTYVDALPALVHPQTGRIHTSFNQTVTATGRLSSSDPNLQNIPSRTEQGRQIRQAFLPKEGWSLVTADYSQIELRLLAHFSADPSLQQAFREDRDIHTRVAAELFKVPEAAVTSQQRRMAKTVNFGVIYGMSAHGLALRLGMPRSEAEAFIDAYFARYPKVLEYQQTLLANAREKGYVNTILGRRRKFDPSGIRANSSYQQRTTAEREAINMEIQGSAADLMKRAMLAVSRRLAQERFQAKMLLTVHDELVFECPPSEIHALAAAVREDMNSALTLTVPLKVDVAAGPNWLDVQEV